ncbi:MAG: hypothetical protein JL55_18625 [Pseudomonas sp. BICA1-14]|nr:hypothetical protein [[Pseudomonas] sp. BICA1-14]KJS76193.1 MAG: hypothetical protein JL55_18625 [[Pseudomonas] sp. BICA1-14]HBW09403.1 hypothetical protein [Pseudomonas sp.]
MLPSFIKRLLPASAPAAEPTECQGCKLRTSALESMYFKFKVASKGQATYDRRVSALKHAYPDIWQEFFAKGSEAKRMEATHNE